MGSRPKVSWDKVIWNDWVIPKHQFMGWILAHGAFKTKTKLISYGVDIDASCWLCGQAPEDLDHLFFGCVYSFRVVQHLQQKTGLVLPVGNSLTWNEGVLLRPQQAATNIVADMKLRIHGKDRRKLTILELDWLKDVGLM
ncbi:uncharacterized protein LOC141597488 [Silene latifolia]|uniref:uncharacterized protein LOC141597488 n=1 Tax=Silene latifolia TaxID=37657 RepID=UPI003D77D91B